MCGIVGAMVLNEGGFEVTEDYLVPMRDTMTHRGPDGAGLWISPDRKVGLAHRRLAIIDLSADANQPMCNEDGQLWVAYNGEIYNHAEIRAELEAIGGHTWRTDHSDTEVILHAFEQWGIDCIDRFRGMFAIALWDQRRRRMWLIRDRIGVKPLYYSFHNGRVTFASEIKALLADPDQKRQVNTEGLYHYMSFLTTPAPQTMFDGIGKLPPASYLCIDLDGRRTEKRYWDVWDHTIDLSGLDDREIAAMVLDELRSAVSYRKVSDVDVGVFLSGGIDSSTNAALFSDGNSPVRTFSIGYHGQYKSYTNELDYARMMAQRVGAEHHELLLGVDDLLDFLPRMIHLQDEPIGDPVCVPVYYVSKLAKDNGVTVCQVGEGADELFCGYPTWQLKLRLQRMNDWPVPMGIKRLGLAGLRMAGKASHPTYDALARAVAGRPIFWGGVDAFSQSLKTRLLSSDLRRQFAGYSSWDAIAPIHRRFLDKAWEKSHLNWMSYLDLSLRLPELLLMRVDKMSMGVSLEGRVPFLDHKFVELAMSIPEAVKTRNGTLKYILKKAVRGLIPDELIDRKKQGFGVPVSEWFFDRLGDRAKSELKHFAANTPYLDPSAVDSLMAEGRGPQAWYLLNLALWHKYWIEGREV